MKIIFVPGEIIFISDPFQRAVARRGHFYYLVTQEAFHFTSHVYIKSLEYIPDQFKYVSTNLILINRQFSLDYVTTKNLRMHNI